MLAAVAFVAVVVGAVLLARSRWAKAVDERVYESRAGWMMPGGLFWKLGRRDDKPGERVWPYLTGLLNGWMYNAGRLRRAQESADDTTETDA